MGGGVRARGLFERMSVLARVAPPTSTRTARFLRDHLPGVVVPDSVVERLEAAGPAGRRTPAWRSPWTSYAASAGSRASPGLT